MSPQASPNSLAQELCDLTNDFALEQLVSKPTRNENILDLVFSNEPLQASNVHVVNGLVGSDHHAVRFDILCSPPKTKAHVHTVYNFKKANFEEFRDLLSKIPWDCCFQSDSIEDC